MSTVHITLVGGQPAPVYNGIKATSPDKVIYIYSSDSRSIVDNIKSAVDIPCEDIGALDPTDPVKIYAAASSLAEKFINDKIILNISGGLKSWTYLFGKVFGSMANCDVIYIDQNNMLWDYTIMSGKMLEFEYDMHTMFRLYGNPIESNYTRFEDYTDDDRKALKQIEQIRLRFPKNFNDITINLSKENRHKIKNIHSGRFSDTNGNMIEWAKPRGSSTGWVRLFLRHKGRLQEFLIESPHAVSLVFFSGWFEFKVADMLSKWDKAKEICLNCKFPFRPGLEKNEVDILVNTGNKVLFVECKTQIYDTTDIDKFCSVVKNYGGVGSKALFITEAPMKDMPRQKCSDHNILTFSIGGHNLGLNPQQALEKLLDFRLGTINIK